MATTGSTTAWTPDDPRRTGLAAALSPTRDVDWFTSAVASASRQPPPRTLTFVGAGGKTTLLHALGGELADLGLRVVLATTTKMAADPSRLDTEAALSTLTRARHQQIGCVVLAGTRIQTREGHKIGPLPDAELARLRGAADALLLEGDGSKRLPFKVPTAFEPVVPLETELLVIVAGLSALGHPLADVCCRAEWVPELLRRDPARAGEAPLMPDTPLTPALAARLLRLGFLDNPRLVAWAQRRVVVLNQADDEARTSSGRALASDLSGVPLLLTSTPPEGRR